MTKIMSLNKYEDYEPNASITRKTPAYAIA